MKATINGVEIVLTAEQIQQIADAKKPKKTAKEWLEEFMKQEFTVKFTPGCITYYIGDQWIFKLDFKNKVLWCYYPKVWKVFEDKFGMDYQQIQALHAEVVAPTLNCRELAIIGFVSLFISGVAPTLDCRELTIISGY